MARQKIAELVEDMALPVVREAGLELVEVEYVKEGGRWYLRIFIDKPGGIGVEDCRYVSEKIDKLLDEKDPIPRAYTLEVSSPGLDRPLKKREDYSRYAGRLAKITTYVPIRDKKSFNGRLKGLYGNDVILDINGLELLIPLEHIASARLEVEF